MSGFAYRNGVLCAEDIRVEDMASVIGTPFYIYSTAQLKKNYAVFRDAFGDLKISIHYANKANPNLAVTATLIGCGAGVDITSIGELERALAAGARPEKIIYSGVGKRGDEIAASLKAGVHQLNVESIPELHTVSRIAGELGRSAPIALRVNPDVDARTHRKISTGETGTKFGIDHAQLDEAMKLTASLPYLDFKGFTVHIGSHLFDYEPFREAYQRLAEMVRLWRGRGFTISRLDLGGGVGIPYDGERLAPLSDYAAIVKETVGALGCELSFEPGRRMVGDAGILVSRVVYDKQGQSKRFLILDVGMNDLIRPAMYDARHTIIPVKETKGTDASPADVVGPVCETGDLFGADYKLHGVGQGDLVAILQAGAYGAAMSSNYNGRPLIPEVLVSNSSYALVRRRIEVKEQMGWEEMPEWIGK